jgi:glutathione synthase/RimK-type ligase-like ATP-grasp enzyme
MFKLYPYKMGSESVRALKGALEGLIIKLEGSKYRPKSTDVIINWGNSRRAEWMNNLNGARLLNNPEAVALAADKLRTFERLQEQDVQTVPWTTSPAVAQGMLEQAGKLFVRATTTGHSGEGITVLTHQRSASAPATIEAISRELETTTDVSLREFLEETLVLLRSGFNSTAPEVPVAPLYTMGIENHGEYRVHVFNDEVILYQKKSRPVDDEGNVITAEGADADVRNLASNWVYRVGNLKRLERVEQLAVNAVRALGLDFGAVDIIMDEEGDVYVLEVNTAVGLRNESTLEAYVNAFNSI